MLGLLLLELLSLWLPHSVLPINAIAGIAKETHYKNKRNEHSTVGRIILCDVMVLDIMLIFGIFVMSLLSYPGNGIAWYHTI